MGILSILFVIVIIPTIISLSTKPQESSFNTSIPINSELSIDVSKHSTPGDCFTIIGSNIYNITGYINIHPGGPIIAEACGRDGTEMFATKGGSGKDHSDFAKSLLSKYLVASVGGPVKNTSSNIVNSTIVEENLAIIANNTVPVENLSVALTLDEISRHNKQSDCWIIIDGNVYDVTDYISSHPGGVLMITRNCGKDATSEFETKGGTGDTHSSFANRLLDDYLLGPVAETELLPPIARIIAPGSVLPAGTIKTDLKVTTDKDAVCKYDTSDKDYGTMRYSFDDTGGRTHIVSLKSLSDGKSYTRYVRCEGFDGSLMTSSVKITFSIMEPVVANLTMEELALHDSQSDCWLLIEGNVYDVTSYISVHPGGISMITNNCGKESTLAFNTKGGSGDSHSNTAKNLLENYLLGPLVILTPLPPSASITAPSNGAQLTSGTTQTTLTAITDKGATCKYDTSNKAYASMSNDFTSTGGTSHSSTLTGLSDGNSYNYYVRCSSAGIPMTSSVSVTFSVANPLPPGGNTSGITMAELATHNTQSDCWLLINGKVYDVTAYIPVHPGGVSQIRNNCGQESTTAFNTRGGSGSHSNNARNLLNNYYIGDIAGGGGGGQNGSQNSTSGLTFTITSSGSISPSSLSINEGDTVTFVYSNPGDEIILQFSPQPPNDMKLDHEYTQKTYTFNNEGTYTFHKKDGGPTATIIVGD